jgi:putative Holliday junction resolvase
MDYGKRRLGFAVSDTTGALAFPLRVVTVHGDDDALRAVREVCRESGTDRIVVGLPLNMDGSRGAMAEHVAELAERMRSELDLRVATWDERLSTSLVERSLIEADTSRARRRQVRDKLAAQIILQGYLDAQGAGEAPFEF